MNENKYALCRKQLNSHFQIKTILELLKEWIPDAIAFVQAKIDALPNKLPYNQLSLEEHTKDYIIENNPNDPYYKMMEKLYDDMKRIQTHLTFYKPQSRLLKLHEELNALHSSAVDSVNMAIHGIAIAQFALHNAIRIRAKFEFTKY